MEYDINNLLKQIAELEAELKTAKKYGLVWDKETTKEDVVLSNIYNIPYLSQDVSRKVVKKGTNNILIEGDNYHALTALNFVLKDSVDMIYIDPPYNTGHKDFVYNDKYINEDDGYRHSKWLSFMEARLSLMRELLKPNGVIFISIDENEVFQLKLLCDKIFGEHNYIENFIWIKNSIKNLSLTTSTNHEYILCYGKNIYKVGLSKYFRIEKPGLYEVKALVKEFERKKYSIAKATSELRDFYKANPGLKGISMYNNVEIDKDGHYRVFRLSDISAPVSKGATNVYTVLHPVTKKPCKIPSRGWAYSESTMKQHIENGLIFFNKDESYVPAFKRYLDNVETEVCKSTFENFDEGKRDLANVFNSNNVFENPKPVSLIKHLIRMVNNKESLIMDVFAGSGTTGQAVLELNNEDDGNRRFILCTNNENNICTDITYPRIKTIITGKRTDGSKYGEGLASNLYYFKTDFVKDEANTEQAKYNLVEKVDALLCVAENIFDEKDRNDYSSHFVSGNRHLFIYNDYYNVAKFNEFKNRVLSAVGEKIVYIYSSDNSVDESLIEGNNIVLKPIPSKIYEIYKEIVEDIKRDE